MRIFKMKRIVRRSKCSGRLVKMVLLTLLFAHPAHGQSDPDADAERDGGSGSSLKFDVESPCEGIENWLGRITDVWSVDRFSKLYPREKQELLSLYFKDRYFVPIFGKSFARLSSAELGDLNAAMRRAAGNCTSGSGIVTEVLGSRLLSNAFNERGASLRAFSYKGFLRYVQEQQGDTEVPVRPAADMVVDCADARQRYEYADRQLSRLFFKYFDERTRPGMNFGRYVLRQVRPVYIEYDNRQKDAIRDMERIESEVTQSLSQERRNAKSLLAKRKIEERYREIEGVCSSESMPLAPPLTSLSGSRVRYENSPDDDARLDQIRTEPPKAQPVDVPEPVSFDDPYAVAIQEYLLKDCSRSGLYSSILTNENARPFLIFVEELRPSNGYCMTSSLGTSGYFGISDVRNLRCDDRGAEVARCEFEVRTFCSFSSTLAPEGTASISDVLCGATSGRWHRGFGVFAATGSRNATALEMVIDY